MKDRALKAAAIGVCAAVTLGCTAVTAASALKETSSVGDVVSKVQLVSGQEKSDIEKDETVYVLAGADGSVKKIIVSDWIKNNIAADKITDQTPLENVENVKGDESYVLNGENMRVWDAQGNDIYCQGTIEKELPVNLSVSYKLDSRSISAEELAGKSGRVSIRFDYKNNQYETVSIDGKDEKIYVPFAMLTGIMLDTDKFTNVEITNGKLINDGSRIIAAGIALPGLQSNLNVDRDKFEIPDYVEITADVKEFEMTNTVTVATNELFSGVNTDGFDDLSDLEGSLGELEDAMNKLINGSASLYGGLCTLLEKSDVLVSGIDALVSGATELKNGADTLDSGAGALESGTAALNSGAGTLKEGTESLVGGLSELCEHNGELNAGAEKVFNTLLSSVNDSVAAKGITIEKLTIENYKEVLSSLLNSPDDTQKAELIAIADSTLNSQLAAANVPEAYYPAVKFMLYERLSKGMTTEEAMAEITTVLTHAGMYAADHEKYASFAADALTLQKAAASAASDQGKAAINGLCLSLASKTLEPAITSAIEQLDEYNEFYTGIADYTSGAKSARDGAEQLAGGASSLKEGTEQVNSGASALKAGTAAISAGAEKLLAGVIQMKDGTPALINGITALKDGSYELKSGLGQFGSEGVEKLVDAVDGDLGSLVTRIKATVDVSKDYRSFSGLSSDMSGKVKFIYRTDAIKVSEQ